MWVWVGGLSLFLSGWWVGGSVGGESLHVCSIVIFRLPYFAVSYRMSLYFSVLLLVLLITCVSSFNFRSFDEMCLAESIETWNSFAPSRVIYGLKYSFGIQSDCSTGEDARNGRLSLNH